MASIHWPSRSSTPTAGSLPFHHRDALDRMLIAQAQMESLILITVDSAFAPYEVDLLPRR